jgi:hypothetical protein
VPAALGVLLWAVPPAAARRVVHLRLVHTIHTSKFAPPSPDPSGIVYRAGRKRLLISDSEVDETRRYRGRNLFTARRRSGRGYGSGTTLRFGNREPSDLGLNRRSGALFASDDDKDRISRIWPGRDGVHGTADDHVRRFSTAAFGSHDPEGVAFDPATGRVAICDGGGLEMFIVNPVNHTFGDGNDIVKHFDLARHGLRDCEGLGLNPHGRNKLLAVDWRTHAIYKFSMRGRLLRKLSLSRIHTRHQLEADVTMAPTSSRHDKPSHMDYWVVDRHVDNKNHPNENDGLVYELAARH